MKDISLLTVKSDFKTSLKWKVGCSEEIENLVDQSMKTINDKLYVYRDCFNFSCLSFDSL